MRDHTRDKVRDNERTAVGITISRQLIAYLVALIYPAVDFHR